MADAFDYLNGYLDPMLAYRYQRDPNAPQQPLQYQTAPDTIPLSLDRTPVPDTGQGTWWSNARQAAGDIGTAAAGLAERFNKGVANTLGFRQPGGDIYRAEIPVQPGLERAGDVATFATGGLANSLFPAAGAYREAARFAAPAAREASRDVLPALQRLVSDEAGAVPLPRRLTRNLITVPEGLPPEGVPTAAAAPLPELETASPMMGHNNPPPALGFPQAKFPQYAEAYPEVGPPTMKPKDSGEGLYPAKTLTPEATAFEKERTRIMADMRKKGYTPYFDPEARSYVDPSNYPPPNVDTSTVGVKKPDAVARYAAVIDQPETKEAIRDAYAKGTELGNAHDWYAMAQLEKAYTDELGPEAGRAAFLDEYAVPMSATTSGNKPVNNFLMAHYLEYLRKNNLPMPTESHELPVAIGGRRAGVNLADYARMRERGGYAGLAAGQPKMHDFTRSMVGDLSHAVIDEQMASGSLAHAPGWADKARTGAYGQLQRPVHEVATELGLQPGNLQDVAWAGFKGEPGQPMISVINDSIERTHRLTGMPREEIVRRGLVRKEIPMYGLLGAIGLGATANEY
jgi:hypothetical protein